MRRRRPPNLISNINVVPYLDVMLVLLVIFMITAPLLNQGVVDLPAVGTNEKLSGVEGNPLFTNFHTNGNYSLSSDADRERTLEEIADDIAVELLLTPERPIVLAVDGEISHQDAIAFYYDLRAALNEKGAKHGKIGFSFTAIPKK